MRWDTAIAESGIDIVEQLDRLAERMVPILKEDDGMVFEVEELVPWKAAREIERLRKQESEK